MEVALGLVFVAIAALGAATGRWSVLLVPLVVWPAVYAAIGAGLVGSGLGESWGVAAIAITTASLLFTAALILLRRTVGREPPSS